MKYLFIKLIRECNSHQCMGFLLDNTIYAIDNKYGKQLIETRFLNEQGLIGKLSNKLIGLSKVSGVRTLARRVSKTQTQKVVDAEKKLIASFKKVNKKYESTAFNWGKRKLQYTKDIAKANTQVEKDAIQSAFNKDADLYRQKLIDLKAEKYELRKKGIERGFRPKSLPNAQEIDKFKKGHGVADKMYSGEKKAEEAAGRIAARKAGVPYKKY